MGLNSRPELQRGAVVWRQLEPTAANPRRACAGLRIRRKTGAVDWLKNARHCGGCVRNPRSPRAARPCPAQRAALCNRSATAGGRRSHRCRHGRLSRIDPPDIPSRSALSTAARYDEPIRFRAKVVVPGESFDQTGVELPLPTQVAPADSGQVELFGYDYSQPASVAAAGILERERQAGIPHQRLRAARPVCVRRTGRRA